MTLSIVRVICVSVFPSSSIIFKRRVPRYAISQGRTTPRSRRKGRILTARAAVHSSTIPCRAAINIARSCCPDVLMGIGRTFRFRNASSMFSASLKLFFSTRQRARPDVGEKASAYVPRIDSTFPTNAPLRTPYNAMTTG